VAARRMQGILDVTADVYAKPMRRQLGLQPDQHGLSES
jgi:hypothetical protein